MILDNERQRQTLLDIIAAAQFSGQSLDEAYGLKKSILNADLKDDSKQP
tara:strand:+ start:1257 stop:1403 length:147 start_codon:yes stop_codon:yes gene_type:complete